MTVSPIERGGELVQGELPAPDPTSTLQQFAADGAAAYTMALNVWNTPFVPLAYKRTGGKRDGYKYLPAEAVAANITAAWLAGDEVGLRPMQALQSIDIIEGRPALNAMAQRALVQAAGHEIWVEEQTVRSGSDMTVTVKGRRRGSSHEEEATWTLARARRAGLLEKDNWQNHPLDMLTARATSRVCRLIASDVLLGLGYSAEELADGDVAPEDAPVTMERRPAVEAKKEPAQVAEPAQPAQDEPEGEYLERAHALDPQDPSLPDKNCLVCGRHRWEDGYVHTDDEVASDQGEEQPAPPSSEQLSEQPFCGHPKEGTNLVCSREPGHTGRHHFGRELDPEAAQQERREQAFQEPAEKPTPVDPETSEPELKAGISEPEEDLFVQPSEEEQARAYEEEQAARQSEQQPQQQPVAAAPAGEMEDDPWADFE